MNKVIEITDQIFEEDVLRSDLPAEVDFWAPWCGPCMMVSTIYDKLSREYDGRFNFCKINVNENQRKATKYQIMCILMQMFFADGQKVGEILSAVPEDNKQHSEKVRKWAEKAKNVENEPMYHKALGTAEEMEKANEQLSQVLM